VVQSSKAALDAASLQLTQAQKQFAAAKSVAEKAASAVSKAAKASEQDQARYLDGNDALVQLKNANNPDAAAIAQQQAKVGT
jgi:hypothetical protein